MYVNNIIYFQDEIIITKDEFNKLLYQGVKLKVKVKFGITHEDERFEITTYKHDKKAGGL